MYANTGYLIDFDPKPLLTPAKFEMLKNTLELWIHGLLQI